LGIVDGENGDSKGGVDAGVVTVAA